MKIVFTPDWFLNADVLIDGFSFIILFLFFLLSVKSYKLSKNKNTLNLGIGFLLIALAELALIFTKFVLYYDTTFTQQIGQLVVTQRVVKSVDIFYYIGFFWHKFLTLIGLYMIYRIPLKRKAYGDSLLALCFIIISALFSSTFYYLFHITALILLVLIISNYNEVYRKNKLLNTKMLIIAFLMQAFSQAIFIISKVGVLYVIAQTVQLVSYLILLILIMRIIKHGTKKKQERHNIRHTWHNTGKRRQD